MLHQFVLRFHAAEYIVSELTLSRLCWHVDYCVLSLPVCLHTELNIFLFVLLSCQRRFWERLFTRHFENGLTYLNAYIHCNTIPLVVNFSHRQHPAPSINFCGHYSKQYPLHLALTMVYTAEVCMCRFYCLRLIRWLAVTTLNAPYQRSTAISRRTWWTCLTESWNWMWTRVSTSSWTFSTGSLVISAVNTTKKWTDMSFIEGSVCLIVWLTDLVNCYYYYFRSTAVLPREAGSAVSCPFPLPIPEKNLWWFVDALPSCHLSKNTTH